MSHPDIDACVDVLLRGGGFVFPLGELSWEAAAFVGCLRSSAQRVQMRITVRADGKFLTVTNPDHRVTEIERRAALMVTDSVIDGGDVLAYEEALQISRRLVIRSVM